MELLQAYNLMLAAVNEEAISEVETETYLVAQVQPTLDAATRRILLKGHPFNTHVLTLNPNEAGEVEVPTSYLSLKFPVDLQDRLTVYNGKVYDRSTQTYWSQTVRVLVVLDIAFAQIPEAYAEWIAREAAVEFLVRMGHNDAFPYYQRLANQAKQTALNSEFCTLDNMSGFNQIKANFAV